ncbi:MAG: (Fe-S)-binding protein [Xanthomonadales bacterium]|nr:(Fe-S)-binding protein [Xanthomonadales bacterium]
MTFATWEIILLSVLIVATISLFVRQITPKIKFITAGQSDRERTDQTGARIFRVIHEVLFQSRVISGRPVVGTLHALVFLGFMVFAFETTDHFLEPYGIPFLSLLGGFEHTFKQIVAVVAVIVCIGVIGLAYRRFVMVSISPDPKSYTSGIVAGMIFLLMVTYLYGHAGPEIGQKANWWFHALLILAFPPLILKSKHFHIIMGPVNVFFRNFRLGEYQPMDLEALAESEDEVTLGLESMKDVSWKTRMDFMTCVECKRCTEQCPAANSGLELQPREFILAGRKLLGTDKAVDGEVIGNVITEKALGQCTSCGACENICPVGIEHTQILLGAKRAQAMATGQGMVAADYLQSVETYGNPFSAPKSNRQKLLEELDLPVYEKGKTEHLLWLGCVWGSNEDARSSVEAMSQVLKKAGTSFGVLETESCSGHHSRRQGEEVQFQTLAGENLERFNSNEVKSIISPCPHCLHTFRREYPTLDQSFSPKTIHHSEFMAQLVSGGKLKLNGKANGLGQITFHDPCYLGRYEGVFDEPRSLIQQTGNSLIELPRHGARSFCCGGGSAGFARGHETGEGRVDLERKKEVSECGARTLVTGCPECKMMLDGAVDNTMDLAELINQASL